MGYTHHTFSLIEPLLSHVESVIDLGAQNDYRYGTPAPYTSEWYKGQGIQYIAIDLSRENKSLGWDLSKIFINKQENDLVVDAGTSEHVGDDGKFGWQAIYNCWQNKHNLLKLNGFMVNENPKTGNWPGHGFNYYTQDFYRNLEATGCYKILSIGEHPAMGNTKDGWNVWCVLEKVSEHFPTLATFKKLGICKR